MSDQISLNRIAMLHPACRNEALTLYNAANSALTAHSQVRIVQGLRTFAEQQALYNQGRTTPGPVVTKAKAGQSYHNYGLAIDFCLIIDGKEISWNADKDYDGDKMSDWLEVVQIFVKVGWKWGKSFNDLPHLEKSFGYDWRDLLAKHEKRDFIAGTEYVNL